MGVLYTFSLHRAEQLEITQYKTAGAERRLF